MVTLLEFQRATRTYGKSVVVAALTDLAVLRGKEPTAVIVDEFYVANESLASETKVPFEVSVCEERRWHIVEKGPRKRTGGKRRRNPDRWT